MTRATALARTIGLTFGLLLVSGPAAHAAMLVVNTTKDELPGADGQCSLREAITAANSPGTPSDCGKADALSNTIVLGALPYSLTVHPDSTDDQTTGDLDVNQTAPPLTIRSWSKATPFHLRSQRHGQDAGCGGGTRNATGLRACRAWWGAGCGDAE